MPRSDLRICEKSIGANIDISSVMSSSIVGRLVFMMTFHSDLDISNSTMLAFTPSSSVLTNALRWVSRFLQLANKEPLKWTNCL